VKCSRCRAPAQVRLPRIKAGFCPDCFKLYVERQAAKAVKQFELIRPGDKVLVAVSGGKDSLGLWDLLLKAGVRADGLYIHLGIGDYSVRSGEKAKNFAAQRQVTLHVVDLPAKDEAVPDLAPFGPRSFCSTCGTIKRHYFNRAAAEGGFTVLATGHNLDDEAGRLLGNVLRWQEGYLAKQAPSLPAEAPGLIRRIKPLIRLDEYEMAAYCFLSGIDYIIEECPHAKGATSIKYKQVLHHIEALMPGTKWNFYAEFQSRRALFAPGPAISSASPDDTDAPPLPDARWRQCSVCGQPSWLEICGFCRLKGRRAGSESPD
jgi:tRNA(Ile)-lysidine synthase TilS/MesJ